MTDYTAAATSAQKLAELQTAMAEIDGYAQSEQALVGPLQTSQRMWGSAGETLDTALAGFPPVNNELLAAWKSPSDSSVYRSASEETTNALKSSRAVIGSPAGVCTEEFGSGGIPNMLFNLVDTITQTAAASQAGTVAVDQANQLFTQWLAANPLATPEQIDLANATLTNGARPAVVRAGQALDTLAQAYATTGSGIVSAAQGLKWVGPGSGNSVPGGTTPGGGGRQPETSGGDQGDQQGGDQVGDQAGQQGGEQGGDQAGQEGGQAGDEQGGDPGEMPGGQPTGPGTGLAGMPTIPTPPPLPPLTMPSMQPPNTPLTPPAGLPLTPLPVGGLPVGASGLPRGGGASGGGGKLPGGIGGGIKAGDIPKPGTTQNLAATGQNQIARAGEQLSPQPPLSGGKAPATSGGTGLAGSTPSGTGAGGVPPMMPAGTGAMGAGGGGRAGKSGAAGTIRPTGRKRDRQNEETPGVPVWLRGKAGKDLPGAFPAVPANTRRRQDKGPADTLQLLDEDLWKVEETEAVAPVTPPRPTPRRYSAN